MDYLISTYKKLYKDLSIEDDNTIEKFIDFIYSLTVNNIESRVLVSIYKREILMILNVICNKYPKVGNREFYEAFNKLDIRQIIIEYFVHNYKTHYNSEVLNLYFHYNENYKRTIDSLYPDTNYIQKIFLNQVYYFLNNEIGSYSNIQVEYKNFFDIVYHNNYKSNTSFVTLKLT